MVEASEDCTTCCGKNHVLNFLKLSWKAKLSFCGQRKPVSLGEGKADMLSLYRDDVFGNTEMHVPSGTVPCALLNIL